MWVMTKPLKIKLVEMSQLTADWKATLNPVTLGCTPLVGSDILKDVANYETAMTLEKENELKIDF